MIPVTQYRLPELEEAFASEGIPKFRARQVATWVYRKGVLAYDRMTDLPKELRDVLGAKFRLSSVAVAKDPESRDHTRKLLLKLDDGKLVECVLIPALSGRITTCLSTQVGCPVACTFCASGLDGVERNLTVAEIVDQFLLLQGLCAPEPVTNVVFMGMGEPFLNYRNLMSAIAILTDQKACGLGARRITISTSGIVPGIEKFTEEKGQVRLSVSLHAPRNDLRSELMPINKKYPMEALADALVRYQKGTGRIVTFEYILLDGVNDTDREAHDLADWVKPFPGCKVNLIPFNPVAGTPYRTPPPERCEAFKDILHRAGVRTTLRVRKGADIDAACGQLRLRQLKAID